MSDKKIAIDSMYKGDVEAIISGIQSELPIHIMNAIIAGTKNQIKEEAFVEGLIKNEGNETTLLNMRIGDFATAALDIVGVKKYRGDNPTIIEIIKSKLTD